MYIKVRILIGGDVISPQEVTSREKLGREIGEYSNRDVSGLARFSGSCFGI